MILAWHDRSKLPSFPWRETNDPYRILVAEMLLRQTTREQVSKVYQKVVERYPDAHHLAAADPDELREMLRSLGLAHRARILVEVARVLEEKGGVPSTFEELRELLG